MDIDKARKLVAEDAELLKYEVKNSYLEAMGIIAKYSEKEQLCVGHDILYYGVFETTVAQMTEEEVTRLRALGWFEDSDSWATFV